MGIGARLRSATKNQGSSSQQAIYVSDSKGTNPSIQTPEVPDINTGTQKDLQRSLRMQAQEDQGTVLQKAQRRKQGEGSSSSSYLLIISRFPYTRLIVDQIISLFQVYQIKLGNCIEDSHLIINSIRNMDRSRFQSTITQLISSVRDSQQVATLSLDQLGLETAPQEHTSSSRLGLQIVPYEYS